MWNQCSLFATGTRTNTVQCEGISVQSLSNRCAFMAIAAHVAGYYSHSPRMLYDHPHIQHVDMYYGAVLCLCTQAEDSCVSTCLITFKATDHVPHFVVIPTGYLTMVYVMATTTHTIASLYKKICKDSPNHKKHPSACAPQRPSTSRLRAYPFFRLYTQLYGNRTLGTRTRARSHGRQGHLDAAAPGDAHCGALGAGAEDSKARPWSENPDASLPHL